MQHVESKLVCHISTHHVEGKLVCHISARHVEGKLVCNISTQSPPCHVLHTMNKFHAPMVKDMHLTNTCSN